MPDYQKEGTGNPIVKDGVTEHFTDAAKSVLMQYFFLPFESSSIY